MVDLSVCIEMAFTDRPLSERVAPAAEAGADAVEVWDPDPDALDAVVDACTTHDVDLAAMVGSDAPLADPEATESTVADLRASIRTADRIGCPTLIVTVGPNLPAVDDDAQQQAIVDALDRVAPDAKAAGVTLVVEPLNTTVDHPEYFLSRSDRGFDIVAAVDSPNVQLLYDIYHQQITEGNLIATMTEHVDRIGHVHVADVPGRHEPGTGEIAYERVFEALVDAGYDGVVGCEFSPTGDTTAAVERSHRLLSATDEA